MGATNVLPRSRSSGSRSWLPAPVGGVAAGRERRAARYEACQASDRGMPRAVADGRTAPRPAAHPAGWLCTPQRTCGACPPSEACPAKMQAPTSARNQGQLGQHWLRQAGPGVPAPADAAGHWQKACSATPLRLQPSGAPAGLQPGASQLRIHACASTAAGSPAERGSVWAARGRRRALTAGRLWVRCQSRRRIRLRNLR